VELFFKLKKNLTSVLTETLFMISINKQNVLKNIDFLSLPEAVGMITSKYTTMIQKPDFFSQV
jgi:hypothetical protein